MSHGTAFARSGSSPETEFFKRRRGFDSCQNRSVHPLGKDVSLDSFERFTEYEFAVQHVKSQRPLGDCFWRDECCVSIVAVEVA
jgi:hypothetical protein